MQQNLASPVLHPCRESVPRGGFADRYTDHFSDYQKCTGAQSCAVRFTSGPNVVSHQNQQKYPGKSRGNKISTVAESERQTGYRRDQQCRRRDVNKALVRRRIAPSTIRGEQKRCENRDVSQ